MRQILAVWVVLACCGVSRGNIIYVGQTRTSTATATDTQGMPVTESESATALDFSPFRYRIDEVNGDTATGISVMAHSGSITSVSVLNGNQLSDSYASTASATGISTAAYGVASCSGMSIIQFRFDSSQPASFQASITAGPAFVGGVLMGDDVASALFSLTGFGQSFSQTLPFGAAESITVNATLNPQPGALYTLTLLANISTDGLNPLRLPGPLSQGVSAGWSFNLTQAPEPSTLALALVGMLFVILRHR